MTFDEWTKKKKKDEGQEETKAPSKSTAPSSTKGNGNATSFESWTYRRNAYSAGVQSSQSAESWVNNAISLLTEAQQYLSGWHDKKDNGYAGFGMRADALLSSTEGWRRVYANNAEALKSIDSVESALTGLKSNLEQYRVYYGQWKTIDAYNEHSAMHNVSSNKDFDQYKGYVSTEIDGFWDRLTSKYGLPYEDLAYEYINNQNGMRSEIDRKAVSYGADTGKTTSIYKEKNYDLMTDEEVATYNYHYAKSGKAAADKYLNSIQPSLNYRKAGITFEHLEDNTALELLFGIVAGVDQFESGVKSFFDTKGEAKAPSATQITSGMVREDLGDVGPKLPDWMGGASLGQAGYDTITTTANMAPSILTSVAIGMVNPAAGTFAGNALMGTSAAGNAYQEKLSLGYSKEEARTYGLMVGASEVLLGQALGGISKLGGGKLSKAVTQGLDKVDNVFARVAKSTGGKIIMNAGSEAFEEGLQSILEPVLWSIASGEEITLDTEEALYSALLGFVTGGMFEGGQTGINSAVKNGEYKNTGKAIMGVDGGVDALMSLANEVAGVTSADMQNSLKGQIGKVGAKATSRNVGRLYETVQTANDFANASANQADIAKSLIRKGFSTETANDIAEALVANYNGQELTKAQQKLLKSAQKSQVVQDAVSNIMNNTESTMGQRSQNIRDFNKDVTLGNIAKASGVSVDEVKKMTEGTFTSEAENGSESHYEASADGKTVDADGNIVSINGIASIEKGRMMLMTEDGNTIDAKSVAYSSKSEALVYEAVASLDGIIDTDTANELAEHLMKLGNASSDVYAKGIKQAYTYGYYGYGREAMNGKDTLSATLTEEQRNVAYGLGEQYRTAKTTADQAAIDSKKTEGVKNAEKNGKVHFEGDRNSLTKRQKVSLSALETVADALGVQVYVFESKVGENGKRIGANGWYDPKDGSIHIDLHAGATGEGTMLFTAAHELVHFIRQWSPAKFKILADFLMEEYGKKGVNVDALVREQMTKAKRNGRTISYDTAYEEVVADSMETMLSDGKVMEKLAKLKQKDESLWQKIKDFISELAAKIRKVYKGMTPDSREGRYVADMVDAIEKLQEMFTEALVDASENYQANLTPGEESVAVNQNGDPVAYSTEDGSVLLSLRTYEEDGRKVFRDYLKKCVSGKKLTKAEMQEMLDGIEEIYQICKEFKDKYAPFSAWSDASVVMDTHGKPVFSVVTHNGDYKMNLDFSLVCKKRRTLDAVFNEMSKRGIIDNFELGQKSVVKINEIIRKYGLETACALCFVDAKRFRQASMADSFTRLYNELVLSLVPEGQKGNIDHFNFSGYETIKKVDGGIDTWASSKLDFSHIDHVMQTYGEGTVEHKAAKYIKTHAEGRKLLLRGDFMSSKGFDAVKTQNKDILKLYNSKKGTGGPKAAFGDVQYMNEIVKKARTWTPEKAYSVGGVRIQSFSDYVPRMVFDYVQMVYDLAATKLPAHAYTKEALFVKQFGLTGIKINMSLIPAIAEGGIAPGLDANGNYVWAGESFDYDTAKEIQNAEGYSENCGTICVGVSHDHIVKLLRDPNIRMVIPYHKSGLNPIVAHMNKIAEFHDYTNDQRTKGADGKALDEDFDFSKALHDMGENASPKAVADQYLKWCAVNGYTARFAEFAMEDNYYKLLEDFTLYDKDGNYVPQREVRAVFPSESSAFGSMKDLIQEGLQEDAIVEGKRDSSLSKIVDEIQKTLPKTEAEISEEQVAQADRDLEADVKRSDRDNAHTFYSQMAKVVDGVKQEKLGASSVVNMLRGKGVKAEEIKWSGIEEWLSGKKSVTKAELQEFIAGSMLQIEEEQSGKATLVGEDGTTYESETAFKDAAYAIADAEGIDRSRVKFVIDYEDEYAYAYVGSPMNQILEADVTSAEGSSARWGQYKLDGGSNYREIIFKMPASEYSNRAMRVHWGETTGVLAHARIQDLNTFLGKMLFIEEIQSDWHNEGHSHGYESAEYKEAEKLSDELFEEWQKIRQAMNKYARSSEFLNDPEDVRKKKWDWYRSKEEAAYKKRQEADARLESILKEGKGTVPDAPFRDTYHEYVLKRLIRMAAEQDYDSIGWTTAQIQSDRWSDEFAEGYRIEYDQDIPKFLNKYGKKWGTRVGKTVLDNGTEVWSMAITDSMKESVLTEGQPLFSYRDEAPNAFNPDGKTLDEQLDEILDTAESFDGRYLYIGRFTHTFIEMVKKYVNIEDLPIAMNYRDAYLSMESKENGKYKGDGINYHNIGKEGMKSAIESFDRPEQVLLSKKDGKIELVLEGVDRKGNRLLSIVALNTATRNAQKFIEAHIVTSIYGKRSIERYVSKAQSEGRLIYTKKEELAQGISQVQYEGNINANSSSKTTIAQNGTDVNMYSDRDTESVSNRSLLANAFEGVAQNDIEKQRLQEYKGKIDLINSEERKLTELNQKIKDLSFSKGPKDTEAIRDLQFEAKQTANRISTYDKQLLRLEASKPLQDVLNREKKKAYKKAEQKGKEALAAYREKATNTQREMLERWQESRKKGIESREKTAMRHKIQSVVGELNQLLLNEDKKRHVPDNLKKAVADALALVNMDTVGAEEQAAKYADLIAKETDPDKIEAYTVTMENILRQGEKMGQRLKELRDAYEEIQNSADPDIANAYDPVIAACLKELSQSIGNTSLRNMTIEQLSDVYDMYRMVMTKVRDANKTFLNEKKESISNLASRVVGEVRKVGGEHKYRAAIFDMARRFGWNNLKPVYAFERIGSNTMTEAFNNVRAGEDVWAMDVTGARKYYLEKSKKYGYDSWDFKKKYRFKSASELEFELTLEQILSLYAYSKREQAHDHLRLGGFVFDSNIETYKEKGSKIIKYKVNTADAHQITPDILADIIGNLTTEQKGFVDEMQEYLSTTMGAKGNEVTMKMYGVKLFKEKFYFPLKSARQFLFEQNEVSGEVKIKNSGFTNKVVAKANNPVILNNFMDVWAGHVNDMSMYHAFVLPLEDFNRIFNYNSPKQEGTPPVSVKGTIQSAYTPAAVSYVKELITDLNGGAMSDPRETLAKSMVAKFKKAKVFSSLSVVIQQPSAIGRAFALVAPKYFHPTKDGMNHDALWEELKQYAPVAVIKEMGYFDTNMGRSTLDFIKAKEYSGFKEKAKAFAKDEGYRDEKLSRLPALADELTWCSIWNAVKRETADKHKDLKPGSEEFLKAAGERFTEVVTKTQVYDSVLARSANMRAETGLMSMVTSFMAEPTTTINMLEDAIRKGKRGYKGYAAKAFASVATSVILNNALVALVYGMRDDDEDETFVEKYMQAFTSGMLDDINPITYYPFLKDAWSLMQGYDIERSDMSLVSDLADAMKGLVKAYSSEDGDVAEAWWKIAGSVANIGGVPMENILRDVNGVRNFYETLAKDFGGRQTTWGSMGDALESAVKDSLPVVGCLPGETKADKLYDAIVSGDTAYVERLKGGYKDEAAYNNAVRKGLRENDSRIKDAAVAKFNGDFDEYLRLAKEIIAEKHFNQDTVVAAINAEINALDNDKASASKPKASGMFKAEDFAVAVSQGDSAMANAIMTDIIQTAQKNGKTAEEAEESFASSATTACKNLYESGELSEDQAVDAMVDFCGKTEEEAISKVRYWEFKHNNPDTYADDAWIEEYYEDVESSGISIDVFVDYRNQVKGITGEGKKERRMAVIHSLPISSAQKDALYYAEGWAASKLYEAPWH